MSLTPKRQRFVDAYLVDPNATQAAIHAGYSPRTARQQGSRLLSGVDVSEAVRAGQDELTRESSDTSAFVHEKLWNEVDNALRSSDRIRALDLLAKMMGIYKQPVEHSNTVAHAHLHELSTDQLARMEAIYLEPIEGTAQALPEG